MSDVLWQPDDARIAQSNLTRFCAHVAELGGPALDDYASAHAWSVAQPEAFWAAIWSFGGVIGDRVSERVLVDADQMPGARWFPDAQFNFAENLLRCRDDKVAFVFQGEHEQRREMTYAALGALVARLARVLEEAGVGPGDRVGGYLPNMPETAAAMLATAAIGATWSSCSPDFGVQGVVDRFGQIEPKVLFTADGYFYNGRALDCLEKVRDIVAAIPSISRVVVIPYAGSDYSLANIAGASPLDEAVEPFCDLDSTDLRFVRMPFAHPLYVMYSSGTTGAPKCIVHGAGGTLLKHLVEHLLQTDVKPDDRLFYFTTCGWMMWNWLVSGLAAEATLLLYDGSPFHPDASALFDFAERERMTIFGTSAKYIDAVKKSGLKPIESHDLSSVKTILSTGSPLVPESFDFVYQHIKSDVHLASISGGTDIVGCFVGGAPGLSVTRGEIQAPVLGMRVEVFNDQGSPVTGEKGELVCTAPFPSMPVGFWNDPDGNRYRAAYFDKFPGVWCHGDYVEWSETGGLIIQGRSDAVLNPGGVRIGTAEIYRQVEQLDEVLEALVIGQQWQGDVRVVLFVRLADGVTLDDALRSRIVTQIRANTTPRHVPQRILAVPDIPRTKSGKIVELAVRSVVHGDAVKNQEALANPEALAYFKDRPELDV